MLNWRAEENDYIVKDIAQYEEKDSELAKYTILELQNRINKAIEYINNGTMISNIENLDFKFNSNFKPEELLNILKGE